MQRGCIFKYQQDDGFFYFLKQLKNHKVPTKVLKKGGCEAVTEWIKPYGNHVMSGENSHQTVSQSGSQSVSKSVIV